MNALAKDTLNRVHSSLNDGLLVRQTRVLSALILRDIRTRFFGNGLGYLIAIGWPLTHMALLLTLYYMTGRVAPLGSDLLKFLAIAVAPVINYIYMSRFIALAVAMNKPLLNFPITKLLDIILSRAILETACAICCAALLAAILAVMGTDITPDDAPQAAFAFLSTLMLGFGVGIIGGLAATRAPGVVVAIVLLNIVLYATSGVLFMPDAIPEQFRKILIWNPLLHGVEWMREAYYSDYHSSALSKSYILYVGALFLFFGLALERTFRKFLQGA